MMNYLPNTSFSSLFSSSFSTYLSLIISGDEPLWWIISQIHHFHHYFHHHFQHILSASWRGRWSAQAMATLATLATLALLATAWPWPVRELGAACRRAMCHMCHMCRMWVSRSHISCMYVCVYLYIYIFIYLFIYLFYNTDISYTYLKSYIYIHTYTICFLNMYDPPASNPFIFILMDPPIKRGLPENLPFTII